MVKRSAVYEAIVQVCKGYKYEIVDSKTTDSIYLKVSYAACQVSLRFSDHKGKSTMKWFDYSAPQANYADMVRYIENKLKTLHRLNMQKCWAAIA